MDDLIQIRGARQHNLKNIDVDLKRRSLTVITGPSGSGKSSLALDTLFAEGQRRYVESLSTYAKQFLNRMEKPDVDRIDGIAPAVAIEQKNPAKSSRSTVGTATEVYDYLRLLWARVGRTTCPECGDRIRPDTVTGAAERLLELDEGSAVQIAFPLRMSAKVSHAHVVESLRALGFVRAMADGVMVDLTEAESTVPGGSVVDLTKSEEAFVIVDRLKVGSGERERLADSLHTCFAEGEGEAVVFVGRPKKGSTEGLQRIAFTEHFRCPKHPEMEFLEPTPQLFSFNSPYGSCPECTGFGASLEYHIDLIVPNPSRSIDEGAVDPWTKPRYHKEHDRLRSFTVASGVSLYTPWGELDEAFQESVIHGGDGFKGVIPFLRMRERKRYKQYIRVFLRQYQSPIPCVACGGAKLRPQALNIRIGEQRLPQVAELPLRDLAVWLGSLDLTEMEGRIAESILRELNSRTRFLVDVGLGYLSLSRQMRTLSGGEAQRINLANSLGSSLVDTLYVLDEPTVGLHPRDTASLLDLLGRLRDAGNTVIVVEHDTQAIEAADEVLELGPASGINGGEVIFQGTPEALRDADSQTGRFISGRSPIVVPDPRRLLDGPSLVLKGARLHNIEGVDIEIPTGALTVVTGVSGSGKSTLIHDVFYRALERELRGGDTSAKEHLGEAVGSYDALEGMSAIADVVLIDQSPIGRTPRSNPVTYIKAWEEVRRIFASQPLSRQRRYEPGRFSFNVTGGRCEACKGAGHVEIEMIFMADVYVTCEVCGGTRYKPDMLEVTVEGLNISQVLELTVDQAIHFFLREARLGRTLWHLQQVGLGYLHLGQPAPTLSGGEAQRMKIARELSGASAKRGRKLYLLDEPTTGLSGEDVRKLLAVLDRLIDAGNTVVVIEHNLDVAKTADWIIDMGPGAGIEGGKVVAMGSPEEVAQVPESVTGHFLAALLK